MSRRTWLSFRVVLLDFLWEKSRSSCPFHAISCKPFKEILREKSKNNLMAPKEPVPISSVLKPWEMAGASRHGSWALSCSTLRSPNAVEEVCRLGLFRSAMPCQLLSRNSVNIGRAGLRRVRLGVLFIALFILLVSRDRRSESLHWRSPKISGFHHWISFAESHHWIPSLNLIFGFHRWIPSLNFIIDHYWIPVVPHEAVAEVPKIWTIQDGWNVLMSRCEGYQLSETRCLVSWSTWCNWSFWRAWLIYLSIYLICLTCLVYLNCRGIRGYLSDRSTIFLSTCLIYLNYLSIDLILIYPFDLSIWLFYRIGRFIYKTT